MTAGPFHRSEITRPDGVPQSLVCGSCGGKSKLVQWEAFADQAGELRGMAGHSTCSSCGRFIVGLMASDPEVIAFMQQTFADVFGD